MLPLTTHRNRRPSLYYARRYSSSPTSCLHSCERFSLARAHHAACPNNAVQHNSHSHWTIGSFEFEKEKQSTTQDDDDDGPLPHPTKETLEPPVRAPRVVCFFHQGIGILPRTCAATCGSILTPLCLASSYCVYRATSPSHRHHASMISCSLLPLLTVSYSLWNASFPSFAFGTGSLVGRYVLLYRCTLDEKWYDHHHRQSTVSPNRRSSCEITCYAKNTYCRYKRAAAG